MHFNCHEREWLSAIGFAGIVMTELKDKGVKLLQSSIF